MGEGGQKAKFRSNVAAIELVKQLEQENRPATRDEQAVLAKWVGWGGLRAGSETMSLTLCLRGCGDWVIACLRFDIVCVRSL